MGHSQSKLASTCVGSEPSGPAFTIAGKPASLHPGLNPSSSTPGPGEYPLPSTLGGPAFTVAGRLAADGKLPDGPSPGDYEAAV